MSEQSGGLELRSLITPDGTLRITLEPVEVGEPGEGEFDCQGGGRAPQPIRHRIAVSAPRISPLSRPKARPNDRRSLRKCARTACRRSPRASANLPDRQ